MDRADLDVVRLAAAYVFTTAGPNARTSRRLAFGKAQELYRALEDGRVSEESLARAVHGAWCSETRSERFHGWSSHRILATDLLGAIDDPALDDKLALRAVADGPHPVQPGARERDDP